MGENTPQEYRQLSREELEAIAGEELPERAAMSLINANIAIPVNAAVAARSRSTWRQRPTRASGSSSAHRSS